MNSAWYQAIPSSDQAGGQQPGRDVDRHADPQREVVVGRPGPLLDRDRGQVLVVQAGQAEARVHLREQLYAAILLDGLFHRESHMLPPLPGSRGDPASSYAAPSSPSTRSRPSGRANPWTRTVAGVSMDGVRRVTKAEPRLGRVRNLAVGAGAPSGLGPPGLTATSRLSQIGTPRFRATEGLRSRKPLPFGTATAASAAGRDRLEARTRHQEATHGVPQARQDRARRQRHRVRGLGHRGGWGAVDDADSLRALHAAADAGVNLIDTADVYGDGRSERVIRRFLAERAGETLLRRHQDGPASAPGHGASYTPEAFRAWTIAAARTWASRPWTWSSSTASTRPSTTVRSSSRRSTSWWPRAPSPPTASAWRRSRRRSRPSSSRASPRSRSSSTCSASGRRTGSWPRRRDGTWASSPACRSPRAC